jgi:hypothetical protein
LTVPTIVHSVVKRFQTILTRLFQSPKATGQKNEIDDYLKSIIESQPMTGPSKYSMRYSYKDQNESTSSEVAAKSDKKTGKEH